MRVRETLLLAAAWVVSCAAPGPPVIPHSSTLDVASWELAGPFPSVIRLEPYHAANAWEQVLERAAASSPQLQPTRAAHCTAAEIARFFLAHDALPSQTLQTHISTHCGAIAVPLKPHSLAAEAPDSISDARLLDEWQPDLVATIEEIRSQISGPVSVGLSFGRAHGKAVAIVVEGPRRVDLEPLPVRPRGDGSVRLRGRVRVPAERIGAQVNQGLYGFADCEVDPHVSLPRFSILCPTLEGDAVSQISVSVLPPGRLLTTPVLSFQARREDDSTFRPHRYAPSIPVASTQAVTSRLLAAVNEVRERAGLEPVTLDTAQTQAASAKAPEFVSASGRGDSDATDRIVLDLIAGRRVAGLVRRGDFVYLAVAPALDVGEWLTSALQWPAGRSVLLHPDVDTLAFGALVSGEAERLDVVALGYELFDASAAGAERRRVLERLARLRAERHRSPPQLLEKLEQKAREVANQVGAGQRPRRAMRQLMREGSLALHRPVGAYWFEVSDLDTVPFQEELLDLDTLSVAVGVSHRQSLDSTWARYFVFLVVADPPVGKR
ncbi:MAG: hypothetical protein ACE5IL_14335 [Myxococcota bacterium]